MSVCAMSVCTGVCATVRAAAAREVRNARVGGGGVSTDDGVGTSVAGDGTERTSALDRSTEMGDPVGAVDGRRFRLIRVKLQLVLLRRESKPVIVAGRYLFSGSSVSLRVLPKEKTTADDERAARFEKIPGVDIVYVEDLRRFSIVPRIVNR